MKLHVYVDESDDHREYVTRNSMEYYNEEKHETENDEWINSLLEMDSDHLNVLKLPKTMFLKLHIHILKKQLIGCMNFCVFSNRICRILKLTGKKKII